MFTGVKDGVREEKELPCLDRFLAKNTSEDNASFEQIMELAKDKEKLRHSWLYEAEEEYQQVLAPEPKHTIPYEAHNFTALHISYSAS